MCLLYAFVAWSLVVAGKPTGGNFPQVVDILLYAEGCHPAGFFFSARDEVGAEKEQKKRQAGICQPTAGKTYS